MHLRILVVVVLMVSACSGPVTGDGGGAADQAEVASGDSPSVAELGEPPADVLTVSCQDGTIELGSVRVRTRADGLHLDVRALPGDGTSVEVSNSSQRVGGRLAGGRGGAGSLGVTVIATVGPGEALVRCYPDDGPRHFQTAGEDPQSVTVEVLDEAGHWNEPPRWRCAREVHAIHDHFTAPTPGDGPATTALEEVASNDLNQPREVIQTFGYKDADIRWAGIVQANRLTTLGSYQRDGGSWRLESKTSCDQP